VASQRNQPGAGWKIVGDDFLGRAGEHRLAAVGQIAQARSAVNGRSDVVAFVTQLDLAGVQTDPQPDRRQGCQLQIKGTRDRVAAAVERYDQAVAPHPAQPGEHRDARR
jgi:hypothetical protein